MVKENNNQEQPQSPEIDKLAIETVHELGDEMLNRFGKIQTSSLSEEEKEKEIEKLLEEMNARGNEMYKQKKQKAEE